MNTEWQELNEDVTFRYISECEIEVCQSGDFSDREVEQDLTMLAGGWFRYSEWNDSGNGYVIASFKRGA